MRKALRALMLGFCLTTTLGIHVAIPVQVQAQQKVDLPELVERMSVVQTLFADGSSLIEVLQKLDLRVTSVHFDDELDLEIDADIVAYEGAVTAMIEDAQLRMAELRETLPDIGSTKHRTLIERCLETIDILHTILDDSPTYLRDLLAAARTDNDAEFDRLSHLDFKRSSALLRTENALVDLQLAMLQKTHPTYYLQLSMQSANEGLALFLDAAARIFADEDPKIADTSEAMRVQSAIIRDAVETGTTARPSMKRRMLLPSLTRPALRALRSILSEEYVEAFAVEAETADHVDALAAALENIAGMDDAEMDALDQRTLDLANRRLILKQTILKKMRPNADKL